MSKHIGSSLTSFFDEEGIREEVDLRTKKKVIADQLADKMRHDGVTKARLARLMDTSRSAVDRLLDPDDTGITFNTLAKASAALKLNLLISLEARPEQGRRKRR